MTDYKKIADMMQTYPTDPKEYTSEEFNALMEERKLKFVQKIDTVEGVDREVWGNRNFQIIVLHKYDNYKIL